MTGEITKLTRSRGSLKRKLTQFKTFLDLVKSYPTLSELHVKELEMRVSGIENIIQEFDTLQLEIECQSESVNEEYEEREKFETEYYQLLAAARTILDKYINKDGDHGRRGSGSGSAAGFSDAKSGGTCNHNIKFHLPKINIPKFDGSYQNWLEFRDTFTSMIHDVEDIDNISKFHYLRASLHGSAAVVIKNLDFSKDNYTTAWQLLLDRYDNSRLLVQNHVQALFNVDSIPKESSKCLRYLIDITNKNIRALTILKEPTQYWDTLIVYMMSTKLDATTSRKWEEYRNNLSQSPTLDEFCKFLRNRADLLESIEESKPAAKSQRFEFSKSRSFHTVASDSERTSHPSKCPMVCKSNHLLYQCDKFKELSVEQRIAKAKKLGVCLNCLKFGHITSKCKLPHCRYCRYKHSTLLHLHQHDDNSNPPENVAFQTDVDETNLESDTATENVVMSTNTTQNTTSRQMLLSTALVAVYDSKGKQHTARIMLDNASTTHLVTQQFVGKLGLSRRSTTSTVTGIGNQSCKSSQSCSITIHSLYSNYKASLNCTILPTLTKTVPSKLINLETIPIPSGIQLADPRFNIPATVDILVGADIFWSVLCGNSIELGKSLPKLFETKLGWLVVRYDSSTDANSTHYCNFVNQEENISRLWELDSIPTKYSLTSEERACEEKFQADTYRNEGRFVVTMPLKKDPHELGDSYARAKTRFLSLERRFQRDSIFKEKYFDFLQEYLDLGHMTENTIPTYNVSNNVNYYLPHHGVIRESSTTTKLRTVFDASAVTSSGLSLNDIQLVGPTVQDDLLSILLRFRQHKYVISGDIEKMYRAIEINPIQRSLQQIVFRFDPSQPLKTYTLNTVTYGTASAPYLATKCLTSLADTVNDPAVRFSIARDFYVDDYLSGGMSKSELIEQTKGVISALSSAKFNLRKFKSNCHEILNEIVGEKKESDHMLESIDAGSLSKTLGLNWSPNSDTLSFSLNIDKKKNKITKRTILSVISQIFDPLGLIGPCVVEAKLVLQKLWSLKLDWDDEVPNDIRELWTSISENIYQLNNVKVPRWILQDNFEKVELHCFSDASERAYGSCIYARSISKDGAVHIQLIASKNKVAPLKPTTIPRLELCAALLSARLCTKVLESITIPVTCRFWCDSAIVLGWLSTSTQRLKPFVRNRVNEINDTTAGSPWCYVPSLDNPADLVSRGVKADLISSCSQWWSGPQFLKNNESTWPKMPNAPERRDLPEVLCHFTQSDPTLDHNHTQTNSISYLIQKHSNLTRLVHTLAYVKRFIFNCKHKNDKIVGHLTVDEIQDSLNSIIRQSQSEMFSEEYLLLKSGKPLPPKHRLLSLSPYIDDSTSIIRVGGRLENSPYSYEQKHPILLCSKHHLSNLIFRKQHLKLLHAGPQALLANVRQNYWPIGGRNLARKTVKSCIKCLRHKCQNVKPIMSQLPKNRTQLEFPFLHSSVDLAGPILIADRKGRGCKLLKSYLCIFVCLAVKAVHLELVTDLSKEAFMAALRRFISRRGKPKTITTDNGTNFVGAFNEMHSFISQSASELADEGIKFLFTPAYSPHFNGMAEAAVRSTKYHLRRILNSTHLTFEELSTCLTQIEAILNSRPLIPLSTDAHDLSVLTPAHFLIGRTLTSVPCPQMSETVNINLLQRHKRVEAIKQHFWHRFTNEYLSTLQQKTKWRTCKDDLTLNSLVLIKDKTTPPLFWLLGRVIKVYPGVDGINRVAEIKTKKGTIRRGWNNLCALPLDEP